MKNIASLVTAGILATSISGCDNSRGKLEKMECIGREGIPPLTVQQIETIIQDKIVSVCGGIATKWGDSAPFTVINSGTSSHFTSEPMANVIAEPTTFRKK